MVETDSISEELAAKIDEEIRRIILDAYAKCEEILMEHMDQLKRVAEYLVRNETMDGESFEKLFNGEEVPDKTSGEQLFFRSPQERGAAEETKPIEPEISEEQTRPMEPNSEDDE